MWRTAVMGRSACSRSSRGLLGRRAAVVSQESRVLHAQQEHDERRMLEALELAQLAGAAGEVPVGALLEYRGDVVARGYNQSDGLRDPTAHAELLCIRAAAQRLGGWQALREATLYVTLEPCAMCAGALLQARVGTLVWGAPNVLLGADGSWASLLGRTGDAQGALKPHPFHPRVAVRRHVLAEESAALLRGFFQKQRE